MSKRILTMTATALAIALLVYGMLSLNVVVPVNYNLANASSDFIEIEPAAGPAPPPMPDVPASSPPPADGDYNVQAVLSAKRRTVISSTIDAQISKFNFNNGDLFKKGDVLVEYDCAIDRARLKEAESRQRTTKMQTEAYEKLRVLESASEIEYVMAKENNTQAASVVDQIRGRIKSCRIVAPYDGRVTNKMASAYEFAQTGRVLMDISSREPLRAEFLVPSKWLRWLNIGTPLRIAISETDKAYKATIVAVHGEVDPVSQSVQVVAEMEAYHGELLPGMSGQASFSPETARNGAEKGFIGLLLGADEADAHGRK